MEEVELFSSQIVAFLNENDSPLSEDEVDQLLVAASSTYEAHEPICRTESAQEPLQTGPSHYATSSSHHMRFAHPKTDEDIQKEREKGVPKATQQDTKYCLNLWEEWRKHRMQISNTNIAPITELAPSMLQYWLTRFILEVRKRNGSVYPANTLHHICCGLMRHLRQSGQPEIDFFKDLAFSEFRLSLDAEMKRLQSEGIGSKRKQAEILSEAEENLLWERGFLGERTPQTLLDTMVFCNGLYFALRSGKEHRQLRFHPCQIELVEREGERPYLKYTEDVSKNHPGGLKGRKVTPKVVFHHANIENPQRCFVRLFKRYRELCPKSPPAHAFYLRPAHTPTPTCWYSNTPLGHTLLSNTVARLCKMAGIQGYKTNHSLRATSTSRLYQSGVDEQLVMERTGHRSLEGVRCYKRTSDSQRQAISDILNGCNKSKVSSVPTTGAISSTAGAAQSSSTHLSNSIHSQQLCAGLSLPSAVFNNCQVNFYMGSAPTPNQTAVSRKRRAAILDSDSDSD